jgi:hypothetical protein
MKFQNIIHPQAETATDFETGFQVRCSQCDRPGPVMPQENESVVAALCDGWRFTIDGRTKLPALVSLDNLITGEMFCPRCQREWI